MCEAEPGGKGRGSSLGSVLCSSEEYFQILAEQVAKFGVVGSLGPLIIGDFNARCGDMDTYSERLPVRSIIDVVKNSQGEAFVDFLRVGNMTVVNGRKGRDASTCASGRG